MAFAFILGGCSDQKSSQQLVTEMKVVQWAPHSTVVGKGFNIQPKGDSVMWVEATGVNIIGANTYEIWFGDTKLGAVMISPNKGGSTSMSASLPTKLLSQPGKHPAYIISSSAGPKYELGTFEVLPK